MTTVSPSTTTSFWTKGPGSSGLHDLVPRQSCLLVTVRLRAEREKDPHTLEETREVRILMRDRRVHQNLLDDADAPVVGVKVAHRRLS